jgi:hypothetical protein
MALWVEALPASISEEILRILERGECHLYNMYSSYT